MKKYKIRFLILTLIGIFVYSCQNDIEETTQIEKSLNEELASDYLKRKIRKSVFC
jgi:hypothetical protein